MDSEGLEFYKEILSDYRRIEGSLHDRARTIIEECDEFYQSNVPDTAEVTFNDGEVGVSWTEWHGTGCGKYYDYNENFPYEYLWTDIQELNKIHKDQQIEKFKEKVRKERQEKKQMELDKIKFEKAELIRLKEKYPDEF